MAAKKKQESADPVVYFDAIQHDRAHKHLVEGLWTRLGKRYGDLEVRLRAFYTRAVMARQEALEENVRRESGKEPTTYENIQVSMGTILMAITGARGHIKGGAKVQDLARAAGLIVDDGGLFRLTGNEPAEDVRPIFEAMLDERMLLTLTNASKAINELDDAEICRLGEGSTYGLTSDLSWQD